MKCSSAATCGCRTTSTSALLTNRVLPVGFAITAGPAEVQFRQLLGAVGAGTSSGNRAPLSGGSGHIKGRGAAAWHKVVSSRGKGRLAARSSSSRDCRSVAQFGGIASGGMQFGNWPSASRHSSRRGRGCGTVNFRLTGPQFHIYAQLSLIRSSLFARKRAGCRPLVMQFTLHNLPLAPCTVAGQTVLSGLKTWRHRALENRRSGLAASISRGEQFGDSAISQQTVTGHISGASTLRPAECPTPLGGGLPLTEIINLSINHVHINRNHTIYGCGVRSFASGRCKDVVRSVVSYLAARHHQVH